VAEVDQRNGDETPSRDDFVAEHLDLAEAEVGPGQARERTADGQGLEPDQVDPDAHRVRRPGVGSGGPDPKPPRRPEEDVPCGWNQKERQVDQRIVGEEDRAEEGNLREDGDREPVDAGNALGSADEVTEEGSRGADAEHLQADACDSLGCPEGDHHQPEEDAEEGPDGHGEQEPQHVERFRHGASMANAVGDKHAEKGPHGHDPLAAEVENPGSLVEHLAEGGEQEGHAEGNAEGEYVDGKVHEITPHCCG